MAESTPRRDLILMAGFTVAVLLMPYWLTPIGAGYPDLLQRFAHAFFPFGGFDLLI